MTCRPDSRTSCLRGTFSNRLPVGCATALSYTVLPTINRNNSGASIAFIVRTAAIAYAGNCSTPASPAAAAKRALHLAIIWLIFY